ncbi:MAG: FkbM family methyltransferase [Acetobacteraceae bacterium]|nr:FkbM family methyltransferase [Acetobacteraceae bacterium]
MPNLLGTIASANLAMLAWLLPRIDPAHRSGMARRLMQDRFDPRVRTLAGFFDRAGLAWKNRAYDVDVNGEEALLRRLAPFAPRVLVDVGANVGDWTLAACRHLPQARVHAFEIAPSTAEALARNVASLDGRVTVNRVGLSDREGEVEIWFSPDSTTATSTLRHAFDVGREAHGITTVERQAARVITGDAYLRSQGVEHVDMLKIDVEGAETAVLDGFAGAFARGAISLVQFEYGTINLSTRQFLGDFHRFFEERGFVVGKLWPEGVAFAPYALEDEDFVGPNYIACLKTRHDLIDALACPKLTAL